MADPTHAEEFRTPAGEIVWVSPAAVAAAKESRMPAPKVGDAQDLVEVKETGLYQLGRGIFRYHRGDKMPPGAKKIDGDMPALRTFGKQAKQAAKGKRKTGPAENTASSGPSQTG